MAKRTLSPIMKAWGECRVTVGAKPFVKMTSKQYDNAKACVARKVRSEMGKKGIKAAARAAKKK
jgi:hypothetical protein